VRGTREVRRVGLLAGLVVLVVGCRSAADKTRCAKDTAELKTWLKQLDGEGGGSRPTALPPAQKLAVVGVRAGDPLDAPTLTIDGDVIRFDGSPAGSVRDPETAIRELRSATRASTELWAQTHPGKTRPDAPYLVALGTEIPWSHVTSLVDIAAHAGMRRLTFLFEGPTALSEPPSKTIAPIARRTRSGEAVDPSQKVRILEEANPGPAENIFAKCPEVSKELSALGRDSANPTEKNSLINDALPRAIEACGCKVDTNEVKALRWMQYGRYDGSPTASHTVAIAPRGTRGATEVAAPGPERWSVAHVRIVDAAKRGGDTVTLVTRDP